MADLRYSRPVWAFIPSDRQSELAACFVETPDQKSNETVQIVTQEECLLELELSRELASTKGEPRISIYQLEKAISDLNWVQQGLVERTLDESHILNWPKPHNKFRVMVP